VFSPHVSVSHITVSHVATSGTVGALITHPPKLAATNTTTAMYNFFMFLFKI
jgi:hypothetical protein